MASDAKNVVEYAGAGVLSKPPSPPPSSSSQPVADARGVCNGQVKCFSSKLLLQNHANFKQSASPARFMYFNRDGLWLNLSLAGEAFDSLKSAFAEGRCMAEASVGGARYLFDFLRMLQVNLESGNNRSIAWIDEKGKCFFPRMFLAEEDEAHSDEPPYTHKLKIELAFDGNAIKLKREGSEKKQAGRAPVLSLHGAEPSRWPNTRLLREGELVFSLFKDFFMSGIKKVDAGATITAIYQCTRNGHMEKSRNDMFERQIQITRSLRGASNMVYAWHGTSVKGVETILAHGFGAFSILSGPESYGTGVYLSSLGLPHMSAKLAEMDGNGEKHVILCKVVLGNVEKVQAGSRQHCPSNIFFDNAVDDFVNPKWYVVWSSKMNTHIIPECVLSFKPSNIMQGQARGQTCRSCTLEELCTRLKKLLPPVKCQELLFFYDAFKDGKLSRDTFMKEIRLIAGDEILASAVQEIQGPA